MKIVNIKEKILTIFCRAGEQFQWTYDNIKSHKKQGFTPPSPSFSLSLYGEYVTYENENRRVIYLACINETDSPPHVFQSKILVYSMFR